MFIKRSLGVTYYEDKKELQITFAGGNTYTYENVPPREFKCISETLSDYLNNAIRNVYKRVEVEKS